MSKRSNVLLMIAFFAQYVFASSPSIFHNELEAIEVGENAYFEFNIAGLHADIYEARLFYRVIGSSDFQSQKMSEQGYILATEIETRSLNAGKIEYYLALQTISGEIITYPDVNPEQNPNTFNLVASSGSVVFQNLEQLIILSPEPNEVIAQDEFLLAISIPNENADVDHSKTRLLVDGINVSSLLERDENVYIFVPDNMRTGTHNAEFKVFNSSGDLLAKEEWSFRISGGTENVAQFNQSTNVYLDNRFQNISENSNNFFRAGFNWNAAYSGWDFKLKGSTSTDKGYSGQSPNRYGAYVAYNLSPQTRFYLKGGDYTGNYDQLSFWNRRVLGLALGLNSSWFDLDISTGLTANSVEGKILRDIVQDSVSTNIVTQSGIYDESFLAIRPVFNFGKNVKWGLNLINSRQDPKSIKRETVSLITDSTGRRQTYSNAPNPHESLAMGTSLNMNFDNNRIRFSGSFMGSIVNNDATDEIKFKEFADSLELKGSERTAVETAVNLISPFITLSPGLAVDPNLAFQFDTYLSYFNNYLKFTYKNIDAGYTSAGNPYLQRGIRGFYINDNIRLLNNQLFLNLYFNIYEDNLAQKGNETSNNNIGASVSYFPLADFPGLTVSYGTFSRKNDYDLGGKQYYQPGDTLQTTNPEDNTSQTLNVSSNYSFLTGNVRNTATVTVSNALRDDKIETLSISALDSTELVSTNSSNFTVFSLALRNTYSIPLITRFGFSQSSSTLGEGGDNKSENSETRIYAGVEYLIKNFAKDMNLKPFFNFALNQSDRSDRNNYTAGFYVNSNNYGNFSFRFDMIDFGSSVNYTDTILSTRYDVSF